jgi:hypothetical protein
MDWAKIVGNDWYRNNRDWWPCRLSGHNFCQSLTVIGSPYSHDLKHFEIGPDINFDPKLQTLTETRPPRICEVGYKLNDQDNYHFRYRGYTANVSDPYNGGTIEVDIDSDENEHGEVREPVSGAAFNLFRDKDGVYCGIFYDIRHTSGHSDVPRDSETLATTELNGDPCWNVEIGTFPNDDAAVRAACELYIEQEYGPFRAAYREMEANHTSSFKR